MDTDTEIDGKATTDCWHPLFDAPLDREQAERLARELRVLADPTRLRILNLIANHPRGEVCQAEFTAPLGLTQPTVSHHLKVLHDTGLIHREQRGSWAYYRLAPQRMTRLLQTLWPHAAPDPSPPARHRS